MRKRLCAYLTLLLLCGCLILPAKAGSRYSTTINSVLYLPEILVSIPATGGIFINPYEIPVAIDSSETSAQVVSTPAAIENQSEVPLSVSIAIDGKINPESNMLLTSVSAQGDDYNQGRKLAFVYLEIHAVSDPSQAVWDSTFDREKHVVVIDGASRPLRDIVVLDRADKPNRFGAFRLTGDCTQSPRDPWTENDKVDVSIAFTFTPVPQEST